MTDDEVRDIAEQIADEVIGSFAELYPKLALPWDAWRTLGEMIQREVMGHFDEGPTGTTQAADISKDENYQRDATASGLR